MTDVEKITINGKSYELQKGDKHGLDLFRLEPEREFMGTFIDKTKAIEHIEKKEDKK